ncbi:MAG TPA: HDOD domain-containing protein [Sandaracinaceae bacterium LLY-WYZ-13_1]|nr:HDOD domain-containing protein [Sandaracinaceae bacterium LLY-WYZ-13_1]
MPPPSTLATSSLERSWFGDDVLDLEARAARSVAATAAHAVGLKVFPAVARHLMALLDDPDVTIGALREPIEQDPALAARLLRVANSAAYAPGQPCRSIDEAVLRLGTQRVKAIVAGITAFGMFPADDAAAHRIRAHGAGVAAILGVLGGEWRRGWVGDLFLVGLLHDLGKLAAIQVGEMSYERLPVGVDGYPDRVHRYERLRLGFDHAALGAAILLGWNFDLEVSQVVAWHHRPGRAYAAGGGVGTAVALLRIADRVDFRLRDDPRLDEAFLDELFEHGEVGYVDLSRDVLAAMWPKLVAAHGELQRVLID